MLACLTSYHNLLTYNFTILLWDCKFQMLLTFGGRPTVLDWDLKLKYRVAATDFSVLVTIDMTSK